MDCRPKLETWSPLPIYIWNPKLQLGNFFSLCSGAFVADSEALSHLRDVLEMAGELLPLRHQGKEFILSNILECANCLDQSRTQWVVDNQTGLRVRIAKYEFIKSRFSESTLFKIPETAAGEILTVTGLKDADDEFKYRVEHSRLTGLVFEEIWSE